MINTDKTKAIKMRRKGLSYNIISNKLNISKSTLSYWFSKDLSSQKVRQENITEAKKQWAQNIRTYNVKRAEKARQLWKERMVISSRDIDSISERELWLIGIALYWAEGYKKTNWSIIFSNSDPEMNKLMMKFFRNTCCIPLEKMRAQVHIYPNLSAKKTIEYWAEVTGIPKSQFTKPIIQISKRSKLKRGNTLPYGTLRIRINDVLLVNKIKGWIDGLAHSLSK